MERKLCSGGTAYGLQPAIVRLVPFIVEELGSSVLLIGPKEVHVMGDGLGRLPEVTVPDFDGVSRNLLLRSKLVKVDEPMPM